MVELSTLEAQKASVVLLRRMRLQSKIPYKAPLHNGGLQKDFGGPSSWPRLLCICVTKCQGRLWCTTIISHHELL